MKPDDPRLRPLLEGERDLLGWLLDGPDTIEARLGLLGELERSGVLSRVADAADLQAQVMVSRYRPALVGKLLNLAMQDDAPAEQARRALVDLLKLNLRPKTTRDADADRDASLKDLPHIFDGEPEDER